MAEPKILTFPIGTLQNVYFGESFYMDFDLTSIFGKTINITEYDDVRIYLNHKFSKYNIGRSSHKIYWCVSDGFIEITGINNDQARIFVSSSRMKNIASGFYQYYISLLSGGIDEKIIIDAFKLNYAIYTSEIEVDIGIGEMILGIDFEI